MLIIWVICRPSYPIERYTVGGQFVLRELHILYFFYWSWVVLFHEPWCLNNKIDWDQIKASYMIKCISKLVQKGSWDVQCTKYVDCCIITMYNWKNIGIFTANEGFPLVISITEWLTIELGTLKFSKICRIRRTVLQ